MSKGVIVQIENNTAYLLKNDGSFVSHPCDPQWQIGDVVTISKRSKLSLRMMIVSCAALFILFIGSGTAIYSIPTTFIEISANPSIQITLNRFDRVLNTAGLNIEGDMLIQDTSYKHLPLREAYARLLNRLENNGNLHNATVQLVVANNSQTRLDDIEQILRSVSEKYMQANNIRMSIRRYANNEYLTLPHPLPIMAIPHEQGQEPFVQLEGDSIIPNETTQPQPTDTPTTPPDNHHGTPPTTAPPNNHHESPTPTPNEGSINNGNQNDGTWQNGWWHWNCNCAWCRSQRGD